MTSRNATVHTAAHGPGLQVTIELPDGRSVQLPVFETICGRDVASYVVALLGCNPATLVLQPWRPLDASFARGPLGKGEQVLPGTRFRAMQSALPGA